MWKMPIRPGRDAVILPNGNLGYNGHHPTSLDTYAAWQTWHGGAFSEVTPKGDVVWEFEDPRHHHDAQWLPNGHLLYSCIEPLSDDYARRVPGGHTLPGPSGTLYGDVIKEVNRRGETVWEWHAREHLDPALFPLHPCFARFHWPLVNGLYQTRAGEVLMSLRMTSGVIAVDKNTNKVTWHLGPDVVAQQHTPVALGNGNILIYDNGNSRPGVPAPYTRVIEVERASKTVV
jgi:arylsulfotransferase ASST